MVRDMCHNKNYDLVYNTFIIVKKKERSLAFMVHTTRRLINIYLQILNYLLLSNLGHVCSVEQSRARQKTKCLQNEQNISLLI